MPNLDSYEIGWGVVLYWSHTNPRKFDVYIDNLAMPPSIAESMAISNATAMGEYDYMDIRVKFFDTNDPAQRAIIDPIFTVLNSSIIVGNQYVGEVLVDGMGEFSAFYISPENPEPMWATWNWDTKQWDIPANVEELKLGYAKDVKRAEIQEDYDEEFATGLMCNNIQWSLEENFRVRVKSYAFDNALRRETDPMYVDDIDGVMHELTKDQIVDLVTCMNACMRNLRYKKNLCLAQVEAAQLVSEVEAILWPPPMPLAVEEINPLVDVAADSELIKHIRLDAPKWQDVSAMREWETAAQGRIVSLESTLNRVLEILATPVTPVTLIPGEEVDIISFTQTGLGGSTIGDGYTVSAPYGGFVRVTASSLLNLGLTPIGVLYLNGKQRYSFEGLVEMIPEPFLVSPGTVITSQQLEAIKFTPWVDLNENLV